MSDIIEEVIEETVEVKKPQVLLDSDRYWTGQYSLTGGLVSGVEVDSIPEEKDRLKQRCYKLLEDGTWYFDEEKYQSLLSDKEKAQQIAETRARIAELKEALTNTDYMMRKCYEYSLVGKELPYDPVKIHEECQAYRDEINTLEESLK